MVPIKLKKCGDILAVCYVMLKLRTKCSCNSEYRPFMSTICKWYTVLLASSQGPWKICY